MQGAFTLNPASETDSITLSITKIAHDGRGIGFMEDSRAKRGMAVFVAGALPGQKILCTPTRRAKNFLEAELRAVIEDNENLEAPHCPHWRICGGCSLQRLPYAEQVALKEDILRNALQRIGHFDPEEINRLCKPTLASPRLTSFRNKVEFAIGGLPPAPGFRKAGSHAVFPIEKCAAVDAAAVGIAQDFAGLIQESGLAAYDNGEGFWRFLTLRETSGEKPGWIAICLTSRADQKTRNKARELAGKLFANNPRLQAFIHEERYKKDYLAIGEKRVLILGPDGESNPELALFRRDLADRSFQLDATSFFQVNSSASEILAKVILDMAGSGENLLDLYSGAGAPGLLLAPHFTSALFIEADKKAARAARSNAKAFSLANCEIHTGDAASFAKYLSGKTVSLCLLDPPRQGLSAKTLANVLEAGPEKIIYISCNPATLARDAALLKKDYQLAQLQGVDLFPHTPHIESVSLWTKRADRNKIQRS